MLGGAGTANPSNQSFSSSYGGGGLDDKSWLPASSCRYVSAVNQSDKGQVPHHPYVVGVMKRAILAEYTPDPDDLRLGRMAIKSAKTRAGNGWDLLGPDLQEALVAREAARIVLDQAGESYAPAQNLLRAAFIALNPKEGLR